MQYIPTANYKPIIVGARSKARNVFVSSNTGIVISNPTRGMDVWVNSVCVVVALRRADPPVEGVLPSVYKIHNFKINSECELAREPNPSR
jgi:hypothetical protein